MGLIKIALVLGGVTIGLVTKLRRRSHYIPTVVERLADAIAEGIDLDGDEWDDETGLALSTTKEAGVRGFESRWGPRRLKGTIRCNNYLRSVFHPDTADSEANRLMMWRSATRWLRERDCRHLDIARIAPMAIEMFFFQSETSRVCAQSRKTSRRQRLDQLKETSWHSTEMALGGRLGFRAPREEYMLPP